MWEKLGLNITNLEKRPDRGECVAASFRQLLRAYDADDPVAIWLATSSFCTALRLLLKDLLSHEPTWDSKGLWIDGLSDNKLFFQRPTRVRVTEAITWGLRADVGGPQWADPFEADMELTPDLRDLASYTIRFGDRRALSGKTLQENLSRIARDQEEGLIEWAFVFRNQGIDEQS